MLEWQNRAVNATSKKNVTLPWNALIRAWWKNRTTCQHRCSKQESSARQMTHELQYQVMHEPRHKHTHSSKTAGQTSQVSVMLVTWKIRWRFDWMGGPTLRGLRAPGCASHFTSCANRWWCPHPLWLCCFLSLCSPFSSSLVCVQWCFCSYHH